MEEVAPLLPAHCRGSQPLLPGVLLLDFGLYPSGPVSSEQPENGEQHESSHTSPLFQILLQFKLHSEESQSPTGLLECPLRASVICPAKCSYCFSHTNSLGHIRLPIRCLSAVEPFPCNILFPKKPISLLPLSTLGKHSSLHEFCPAHPICYVTIYYWW